MEKNAYGMHLFSDVTILTRKIMSQFSVLNSEFQLLYKNCIALTIMQNNHSCIQLVFEYLAMLAHVCQILIFFMCLLFFSSPEHEVLMVSYCEQSLSVVRRASCVVHGSSSTICFKS